jgi:hypothetical protein
MDPNFVKIRRFGFFFGDILVLFVEFFVLFWRKKFGKLCIFEGILERF